MAPVEPARAAAVAVVATVGVVLAALVVTTFKSKSKKKSEENSAESSVKEDKSSEKPEVICEETAVKTLVAERSEAEDGQDGVNEYVAIAHSRGINAKSATEISERPVLSNSDRSEHLIKQVYKSDDEPAEQTLVSFAEIQFSPTRSDENNSAHLGNAKHVSKAVASPGRKEASPVNSLASDRLTSVGESMPFEKIQPEQSSSFEAISVSSIRRNYSDSDNGSPVQKENSRGRGNELNSDGSISEASKSDTSFETVEVSLEGNVDRTESRKQTVLKPDGATQMSSVQLPRDLIAGAVGREHTGFEETDETSIGAGESLALRVEEEDDGAVAGMIGSVSVDAAGDASFVLLDVATAPSNCKPDLDIVDSVPLDQLELQKSVSLQRLKSSGSDNGGPEEAALEATDESRILVEPEPYPDLSEDDISEALNIATANPGALGYRHAQTLVKMLSTKDLELQEKILAVIAKVAAFTKNQDNLRAAGCIPRLISLLKTHCTAVQVGVLPLPALLTSLINAVTNLAVNTYNNAEMQDCVPPLADLILVQSGDDSVQMSALQALTNLSVTTHHHPLYTRVIQQLYGLVDSNVQNVQLQALKVLVNISCNKEMIPHLLAAKAPGCLLSLLEPGTSEPAVLRWTTLLANIMHTVKEQHLSAGQLPAGDKAASPETMYIALYGLNTSGQLRNKVFVLSRHPCEDIRYQAARIYSGLMK